MWRWLGAVVLLGGCDDAVYTPCAAYTPDWAGVECFMRVECVSCHGDVHDTPPVQTILPSDVVRDVVEGTGLYVVPGDPEASKLWRTISGDLDPTQDLWGVMPWGYDEPLPEEHTRHVREWILDGAPVEQGDR